MEFFYLASIIVLASTETTSPTDATVVAAVASTDVTQAPYAKAATTTMTNATSGKPTTDDTLADMEERDADFFTNISFRQATQKLFV